MEETNTHWKTNKKSEYKEDNKQVGSILKIKINTIACITVFYFNMMAKKDASYLLS
jgi:hypothetical protein